LRNARLERGEQPPSLSTLAGGSGSGAEMLPDVRVGLGFPARGVIQAVNARMPAPAVPAVRAFPVSVKGVAVRDGRVLQHYHVREGRDVVIVTYGCPVTSTAPPTVSSEHKRAGLFTPAQVPGLPMPAGYKRSIAA
jgi:hypothetical protein